MIVLNWDKLINYLLIAAGVLYLTHCGGPKEVPTVPAGYISPSEYAYRVKVQDQKKQIEQYETLLTTLKNTYEKDSTSLSTSSANELKHFFTNRYDERER